MSSLEVLGRLLRSNSAEHQIHGLLLLPKLLDGREDRQVRRLLHYAFQALGSRWMPEALCSADQDWRTAALQVLMAFATVPRLRELCLRSEPLVRALKDRVVDGELAAVEAVEALQDRELRVWAWSKRVQALGEREEVEEAREVAEKVQAALATEGQKMEKNVEEVLEIWSEEVESGKIESAGKILGMLLENLQVCREIPRWASCAKNGCWRLLQRKGDDDARFEALLIAEKCISAFGPAWATRNDPRGFVLIMMNVAAVEIQVRLAECLRLISEYSQAEKLSQCLDILSLCIRIFEIAILSLTCEGSPQCSKECWHEIASDKLLSLQKILLDFVGNLGEFLNELVERELVFDLHKMQSIQSLLVETSQIFQLWSSVESEEILDYISVFIEFVKSHTDTPLWSQVQESLGIDSK